MKIFQQFLQPLVRLSTSTL